MSLNFWGLWSCTIIMAIHSVGYFVGMVIWVLVDVVRTKSMYWIWNGQISWNWLRAVDRNEMSALKNCIEVNNRSDTAAARELGLYRPHPSCWAHSFVGREPAHIGTRVNFAEMWKGEKQSNLRSNETLKAVSFHVLINKNTVVSRAFFEPTWRCTNALTVHATDARKITRSVVGWNGRMEYFDTKHGVNLGTVVYIYIHSKDIWVWVLLVKDKTTNMVLEVGKVKVKWEMGKGGRVASCRAQSKFNVARISDSIGLVLVLVLVIFLLVWCIFG